MRHAPRRMFGISILTVVALAGSTTAPLAAHAATTPQCGDIITTSVTLTGDLQCVGNGLTVGAHGVTLDLNGHTISGSRTGIGIIAADHNDLTIRGGTVTGFHREILLGYARNLTVRDLRVIHDADGENDEGIYVDQVEGLAVQDTTFVVTSASSAMYIDASVDVRIDDVEVTGGGIGLGMYTDRSSITNSTFQDGNLSLYDVTKVTISRNTFTRSHLSSFEVSGLLVTGNRFRGGGIHVEISATVLIRGNTIQDAEAGVSVRSVAPDLQVVDNALLRNRYGIRMTVDVLAELSGLTVAGNTAIGNGAAGIFIEALGRRLAEDPITVSGNRLVGNGFSGTDTDAAGRRIDDGLHLNMPVGGPVTVTRNHTVANADFGIEALPEGSVRDGGGNTSFGNRNGCAGVRCR
ncbi:hypothetical protein GCM10027280_18310 [Micromonospora polyrhachis]|uniref:Right handed beta helix domain-containing protein n=1 Tax=Micromonospora polyrhachis TaxID=1282883 RepID=A0A7W7WN74_9ACTN|nr:right-handed parallel beta-helix repeat-containing protein [Micromonospora polyrhachis]MBB4956928.1 hypothetical protein [Micromonospora polyrhachis]